MAEQVVIVDKNDVTLDLEEKLKAHELGRLHRAVSVFVFNSHGLFLLQQRAYSKYHCPGLWTNTCCTHPLPGEAPEVAAHRRLVEEMGFDCKLKKAFPYVYRAVMPNGLIEYEYDHVFVGKHDQRIVPKLINRNEVEAFAWVSVENLLKDIDAHPRNYTPWFKLSVKDYYTKLMDAFENVLGKDGA
jgi:isopentenyl-diphosphate delta-isomerase